MRGHKFLLRRNLSLNYPQYPLLSGALKNCDKILQLYTRRCQVVKKIIIPLWLFFTILLFMGKKMFARVDILFDPLGLKGNLIGDFKSQSK